MAIALGAGLVAIRKAEEAAWNAISSSFTDFGGEEKSLMAGIAMTALFAILAGAVILGVVMLSVLSSMDGWNPV